MYLGGIVVKATDDLDYADYINYGFRCIVCGEEVFLRKGSERQPHFAHHRYSPNSSKRCSLRLNQFPSTTSALYILNYWASQSQRKEIYQKHLLDIISQSHPDFYQNSDKIKKTLSESEIITQCKLFQNNKISLLKDIDIKKEYLQLQITQKLATKEVIDYLTLSHTLDLLKSVTAYSISKVEINNNPLSYTPWQTKEILLNTDWLYSLVKIVDGSFSWLSKYKIKPEKLFEDDFKQSKPSSLQKAFVGYVELNEFYTIRYLKLEDGTPCIEISEIPKILPHIFKQGQEKENLKMIMGKDFSFSQCIIAISNQKVNIIYIRQLRKIINYLAHQGDFQSQILRQHFDKYTNLGQLFKQG